MSHEELFRAVSVHSPGEIRQTEESCYGLPALLDVVLEQTFTGNAPPHVLVMFTKPLLALILIIEILVAKMLPNQIIMLTPNTAAPRIRET